MGVAAGGGVLIFPIYLISCQKQLDQFQYNLAEMLLSRPSAKIVQAILVGLSNKKIPKTWLPEGRD